MRDQARPLSAFEYFSPESLGEVLTLLQEGGERARLLAGGTDMMLQLKNHTVQPEVIVDLGRIRELSFIEFKNDTLHIGATATLNEIKDSPEVQQRTPLLLDVIMQFGSHMLRNRATIGGNLCHASPAADLAPPLLALDASVRLQGMEGERLVPLSEFFVGPGKTVIQPGEMLKKIEIPCRDGRSGYLKLGRRKGFNISIVAIAAFGAITEGKVEDIKVALCAVGPTPIRSKKAEEGLIGNPLSEEFIDNAARLVRQDVKLITDIREKSSNGRASRSYRRASSPYRVEMSHRLARKVLTMMSNEKGAQK
jgi:carbon-monoxide dehydrogenase medium subunit